MLNLKTFFFSSIIILSSSTTTHAQEFIDMSGFDQIKQGVRSQPKPETIGQKEAFCQVVFNNNEAYIKYGVMRSSSLSYDGTQMKKANRSLYHLKSACKGNSSYKTTTSYYDKFTKAVFSAWYSVH